MDKWIKKLNIDKLILFENYNRQEHFKHVANVVLDTEVFTSGKREGEKKRSTLIQFVPVIPNKEFIDKNEWLYIFTMDNYIVKIGGTRTGIKDRGSSYLCGHHVVERGKSGDCSKTNAFIYNTFEHYLSLGHQIKMYGYRLPLHEYTINILGNETKIKTQTFHVYESTFLEDYKKTNGEYPVLSNNCDPAYKKQNNKKQNNKES